MFYLRSVLTFMQTKPVRNCKSIPLHPHPPTHPLPAEQKIHAVKHFLQM